MERFWSKVDRGPPDQCWLWNGCTGGNRGMMYGRFFFQRRNQKAHRVAFLLTHGEIPRTIIVRHKCDTPLCVNPGHLEMGTAADNYRDMVERGRRKYSRGEDHGLSKLTTEKVLMIRSLHFQGVKGSVIGRYMNVPNAALYPVLNRETWTHI